MRYSKQRELVYNIIAGTDRHFIVDEIYACAKEEMPEIGIATVYRNVNQLCEAGQIKRIKGVDGVDHYDAIVKVHPHFLCRRCNRVYDLELPLKEILAATKRNSEHEIEDVDISVIGICKECKEKEKEGEKQTWN